jgi:hypothetical protein
VTFQFNHVPQENQIPNIRIPCSKLPFQIMAGRERDCVVLTKMRPFDDWGQFKWEIIVGDRESAEVEPAQNPLDEIVPANPPDVEMVEELPPDFQECGSCTFHNDLTATVCEMCGANLGF